MYSNVIIYLACAPTLCCELTRGQAIHLVALMEDVFSLYYDVKSVIKRVKKEMFGNQLRAAEISEWVLYR